MNTIVLMTATGAENLGDELITLCEIQNFRAKDPAVNIILFSHDPSRTWRFLRSQNISEKYLNILPYFPTNIRKIPLKNIGYFLKTLRTLWSSNHLYIGGGGLLYSTSEEGHSPLHLWWMRATLAKILGKPITYLSVGVSAKQEEIQKYAKGLFKNTVITVRDVDSQKRIHNLGYTCDIVCDPVFNYRKVAERMTQKKEGIVIGIALRAGFLPDEVVTTTIQKLLQKNHTIYLLPHSLNPDDINAHDGYYLQKFLFPGVKISQTIEQTLDIYALCDVIIGMRLHSIILASVMNIPLLAISYSAKTHAILTEMNQSFLEGEVATAERLVSEIEILTHSIS